MKPAYKCPICRSEPICEHWGCEWGTEEEHIRCTNCGYYYEFLYGHSYAYIKGKEFTWSYHTKRTDPVFKRMKRAQFMARRNWKKFKRKY